MAAQVSGKGVSIKHSIIEKANSNTVVVVAAAVFIIVFCIFGLRTLFGQMVFQNQIISEKKKAYNQLEDNIDQFNKLSANYETFDGTVINILGGSKDGDGPRDGSNVKLVLDALPSELDTPALASSFEKILVDGGYQFDSISGSERGIKAGRSSAVSANALNEIEYGFSAQGSTEQTLALMKQLESSIRPIYLDTLELNIGNGSIDARFGLRTFYAEEQTFQLSSKEVN